MLQIPGCRENPFQCWVYRLLFMVYRLWYSLRISVSGFGFEFYFFCDLSFGDCAREARY